MLTHRSISGLLLCVDLDKTICLPDLREMAGQREEWRQERDMVPEGTVAKSIEREEPSKTGLHVSLALFWSPVIWSDNVIVWAVSLHL